MNNTKEDDDEGFQESEELEEPHDDEIATSVEESEHSYGCHVQYPPKTPVDNDYSRALDVHRAIFNREVFGTDFENGSPKYVHLQRSRTISSERIDLIIRYLRAKEGDSILCEEMKKEHGTNVYDLRILCEEMKKEHGTNVYDWANHYQLDFRKNEQKHVLLRTPFLREAQAK